MKTLKRGGIERVEHPICIALMCEASGGEEHWVSAVITSGLSRSRGKTLG